MRLNAKISREIALPVLLLILSGCATTGGSVAAGSAGGAALGAGVGALADPGPNGSNRIRNVLIGSGVGAVLGAGTGLLLHQSNASSENEGYQKGKEAGQKEIEAQANSPDGQPLVGSSGKDRKSEKHFYYAHKARKRKSKKSPGCTCSWYSVEAHDIHKVMRGRFKKLAEDPAFVEALFQSADTDRVALIPDNERRLVSLEKEVQEANQQVSNLMDTLQNNPSAVVRDLIMRELETKGSLLKAKNDEQNSLRMQTDQKKVDGVERGEFSSLAKNWDKAFAKLTTTERRQFIRTFVGRIEILPDRLRIRYNYDKRMVARALNILDSAAYQNSFGVGVSAPTPGPFSPKRDQRAWDSNTFRIGRRPNVNHITRQPLEYIEFAESQKQSYFEKVAPFYEKGMSLREISARTGISKTAVRDSLAAGGVTIRSLYPEQNPLNSKAVRNRVGIPAYGFYWLHGTLRGDRKELEVVQIILGLWRAEKSYTAITQHLNQHRKLTRTGKAWDHSLVRRIILRYQQNPAKYEEALSWASKN